MENVVSIDHPLVHHHLKQLRDKNTSPQDFRRIVQRLSILLTYEATKDLAVKTASIETPLCTTTGEMLSQRIGLIPILRAGLGMVDPVLNLIPEAEVWHLGFYRDEQTLKPVEYYKKLPPGGAAIAAFEAIANWGVKQTKLLSMIAAPEGLKVVQKAFPHTQIYVCAIDSHLNEHGYIVPGLGDAGDRIFNACAV